jgi:hypothetical protein
MGHFLMIDIGAGTMDVLWYDSDSGRSFKTVVRSPVWRVADQAAGPGDLVVTGGEMGGGPVTAALQARAARHRVFVTPRRKQDDHGMSPRCRVEVFLMEAIGALQQSRGACHNAYRGGY